MPREVNRPLIHSLEVVPEVNQISAMSVRRVSRKRRNIEIAHDDVIDPRCYRMEKVKEKARLEPDDVVGYLRWPNCNLGYFSKEYLLSRKSKADSRITISCKIDSNALDNSVLDRRVLGADFIPMIFACQIHQRIWESRLYWKSLI